MLRIRSLCHAAPSVQEVLQERSLDAVDATLGFRVMRAHRASVRTRLAGTFSRLRSRSLDDLLRAQRDSWRGGPTFVLSFDVELRADCEALLAVVGALERERVAASFACIGAWVRQYPDAHRALATHGFELLNHTDTHPWHDELGDGLRFDQLDDLALAAEVAGANDALRAIGVKPLGFRTPHFGGQHTTRVYEVLEHESLRYSSSTFAPDTPHAGAPFRIGALWELPLLPCPRHPWLVLDSWHCTTAPDAAHRDPTDLLALYRDVLDSVERHGAYGSVWWDPRVLLEPGYPEVLGLIGARRGSLSLATYRELLA
jgi:peptidoglycan-N-acetylglucosamine deacetylase